VRRVQPRSRDRRHHQRGIQCHGPLFFPKPDPSWQDVSSQFLSWWGVEGGAAFAALYAPTTFATPTRAMSAYLTNFDYVCPARRIARSLARHQPGRVWRYLYTHTYSNGPNAAFGPAHGNELTFAFRTYDAFKLVPDASERALADSLACQWSALAQS